MNSQIHLSSRSGNLLTSVSLLRDIGLNLGQKLIHDDIVKHFLDFLHLLPALVKPHKQRMLILVGAKRRVGFGHGVDDGFALGGVVDNVVDFELYHRIGRYPSQSFLCIIVATTPVLPLGSGKVHTSKFVKSDMRIGKKCSTCSRVRVGTLPLNGSWVCVQLSAQTERNASGVQSFHPWMSLLMVAA